MEVGSCQGMLFFLFKACFVLSSTMKCDQERKIITVDLVLDSIRITMA